MEAEVRLGKQKYQEAAGFDDLLPKLKKIKRCPYHTGKSFLIWVIFDICRIISGIKKLPLDNEETIQTPAPGRPELLVSPGVFTGRKNS